MNAFTFVKRDEYTNKFLEGLTDASVQHRCVSKVGMH